MPLHLTVRATGTAKDQTAADATVVAEGEPGAGEGELARLRRQAAEILMRRFELDPQRYAAEGMEAVLHLLRGGEPLAALEILRRVGEKLALATSAAARRPQLRAPRSEGPQPLRLRDAQRGSILRGIALHRQGDLLGARRALQDAQLIAATRDDPRLAILGGYHLGRTLLALGDLEGALSTVAATLTIAQRSTAPGLRGFLEVLHAQVLLHGLQPAAARAQVLHVVAQQRPLPPRLRAAAYCVLAKAQALHRDALGVTQALASAAAAVLEHPASGWEYDLECVEIALLGARLESLSSGELVRRAERVLGEYGGGPRRYDEARAVLSLTTALLLRGHEEDRERIDDLLGRAQELCAQYAYGFLHLRATLLEAALWQRRGQPRRAQGLLAKGLDGAAPTDDNLELRLLRLAVGEREDELASSALGAVLLLLGLRSARPYELRDRSGSREADESQRQRAFAVHDLIVEPERGVIARGGGASISGRPLMAALLVALLTAGEDGISAERLFLEVWGGREYHPLRHRNTVYVAINRLRQLLRELLPGREVVETTPSGWRLSREIDLCAIRTWRAP